MECQYNLQDSSLRTILLYLGWSELKFISTFIFHLLLLYKVAFDVDLDVIRDKNSPFPAALTETLKGVQESFFAPFWQVDLSSISVRKRLSKTTKFLRDYAKKVIQERLEAISRKDDTPSDILNHILFVAKAEPSLTLEYLVDEFVTFFVAGQPISFFSTFK